MPPAPAMAAPTPILIDQTRAVWRGRVRSALRTIIACTIVGSITLYGPAPITHLLTYPAFSYLTAILIVSDATVLGDALRECWHAFFATAQVMILSLLSLRVIGRARFTDGLAAALVAINAFVLAALESTHLVSKRIAFGQIVIVHVGAVIQGAETGPLMHPVHECGIKYSSRRLGFCPGHVVSILSPSL